MQQCMGCGENWLLTALSGKENNPEGAGPLFQRATIPKGGSHLILHRTIDRH